MADAKLPADPAAVEQVSKDGRFPLQVNSGQR